MGSEWIEECPFCGRSFPKTLRLHLATPSGEGCPETPMGPDDRLTGREGVVSADKQLDRFNSSPTLDVILAGTAAGGERNSPEKARPGAFDTRRKASSAGVQNGGATNR